MAQVVIGGSETFDALLYPDQHPNVERYIQNQFNMYKPINDIGKQFLVNAKNAYQMMTSAEVKRKINAAINQTKSIFKPNRIYQLETLEEFQNPPPVMVKYLMANPIIKEIYNESRCQGYGSEFYDVSNGGIKEEDYVWRQVNSGILNDNEIGWSVNYYVDDLLDGDEVLTSEQKTDILTSWELMDLHVNQKDDPTDPLGDKL